MYKGTVQEQMRKLLNDYTEEVVRDSDTAIRGVAEATAQKLQNDSPKKTGDYAKGWVMEPMKKGKYLGIYASTGEYIVRNKTDWHLTHLLEKGHVVRNAKGTYGRTRPRPHIAPAEEWAADEVEIAIKRKIST